MAKNVAVQVIGGAREFLDNVCSPEAAAQRLGLDGTYTATVNGEAAKMDSTLQDDDYVTFSRAVKGGI